MTQTSRDAQREETKARIVTAARRLFGEHGYDRTTIRSIAAAAGSDAGLVMRYFGSKEKLFAQVAAIPAEGPIAALAALRAMFSHPEAAQEVRTAMVGQQRQIAALMPGDDAVLRAGVIGALTIGAVIGRHLIRLDGLSDASPEEITRLIGPLIDELTSGVPGGPR